MKSVQFIKNHIVLYGRICYYNIGKANEKIQDYFLERGIFYMAKKRIIFLSFSLLFMLSTFVYVSAANGTRSISVTYRNIIIKVNNVVKQTAQEPFIYDNYTYVPLRFVSESLGADVQWDDKTSTISIAQSNAADGNALKAIEKAKEFTASAYDVYRAVEVLYINDVLFYNVEVQRGTGPKQNIYYNTSDTRLYNYIDGELSNFQ